MTNHTHKDTFPSLENVGERIPDYQPTFEFKGEYIDAYHRFLGDPVNYKDALLQLKNRSGLWAEHIDGWLRREDALKLYELAYFAKGDILELGSYHGLSTTILARACGGLLRRKHVFSVDLDPACTDRTKHHLKAGGLAKGVTTICTDALSAVRKFAAEGKRFDFAFIDHSHAYEHVYPVCRELRGVMTTGGFCLFHDFNDARNKAGDPDYGVYQAVVEGLDAKEFEFYGVYGCTALYRAI